MAKHKISNALIGVLLLSGFCSAQPDLQSFLGTMTERIKASANGHSIDDFYDDNLPAEIPVKPYLGQQYEAVVPDTEDLADYANRALNAATRLPHPEYFEVPQIVYVTAHPSIMQLRDGSLCNITPKWVESLPMLRVMTGSTFNIDIDGKMMAALVGMIGKDGLSYQKIQNRPWAFFDQFNYNVGLPFSDIFGEARQLLAFVRWYEHDKNPLWKKLITKKINRLRQLTYPKNDTLFFPSGRGGITPWAKTWPFKQGEPFVAVCDAPLNFANEITDGPATYVVGYYPQACTIINSVMNHPEAFKLGAGLARYLHLYGKMTKSPTGKPFVPIHPGHLKHSLCGNLSYALAINDKEMIKWIQQGFDYTRKCDDPDNTGMLFDQECSEYGDMIQVGIMLSRAGVANYWDTVDRWIRNSFLASQIQQADIENVKRRPYILAGDPNATGSYKFLGGFWQYGKYDVQHSWNKPLPPGFYQPKDGTDACLGAFFAGVRHRVDCTGGGMGNCFRVLYYVWDSILEPVGDSFRVNLLLNRASPWADLDSYIPYEGKVVLKMKTDQKSLLIRIPDWTDWNQVICNRNSQTQSYEWLRKQYGYIQISNVNAGDTITIEFPMKQWTVTTTIPKATEPSLVTLKGNTVIDVTNNAGYPLFLHEKFRAEKAPMKKTTRFVSKERFLW